MTFSHRGYSGHATIFDGKWMVSIEGVVDVVVATCSLKDDPAAAFVALVDSYIARIESESATESAD